MKLNQNQQILNDYLNEGNSGLIQTINRLYMNGEVLNVFKTFQSLMFKLFGGEYTSKIKEFVVT
jgi:hypothetical protein